MPDLGTFDTDACRTLSLDNLTRIMQDLGSTAIYIKQLAPNDNSKNQPYFGAQLTDVSFIPTGDLIPSQTTSNKPTISDRSIKYQASMNMAWVDAEGRTYEAPNAKLIFYPQYPEVRFSGFLKGSAAKASEWMDPYRRGREEGRWLVFGVTPEGQVLAYLVTPETRLSEELHHADLIRMTSIFYRLDTAHQVEGESSRDELLAKLREIHEMGWIQSRKLNKDGSWSPYKAQNGAGYTLEAILGIYPNGIAEPDYLGWEVKQYAVKDFPAKGAGPTTLMTPEPDGGFYGDNNVIEFVKRYGYPDTKGREGRMNFGGLHYCNRRTQRTGLTLKLSGFDPERRKITDPRGFIGLVDDNDDVAASWSFSKILGHWKRKHSQAVYVPSIKRQSDDGLNEYLYGREVELGEGTSIQTMLYSMATGSLYYDPGIKVEKMDTEKPTRKARSQFRIRHDLLSTLYHKYDFF